MTQRITDGTIMTEEEIRLRLRAFADDQYTNAITPEFAYAILELLKEKDIEISARQNEAQAANKIL